MHSKIHAVLAAALISLGASGLAVAAPEAAAGAQDKTAAATAPATLKFTAGEVRKVDTETGKVTIRHEPIENLEMPAMTMVFKAGKPELLAGVKAGDKIRFRAETIAGAITVTEIQPVR